MAISAQDVKELRELTQAGMMDCKRALTETNGDKDAAIKYLREKGLAKAAKKSGRIAAEGLVYAYACNETKTGVVLEVNCETDFAAKTERFKSLVKLIAELIGEKDPANLDELKTLTMVDPEDNVEKTVETIITERVATIGENIQVRRFARFTGDVYAYVHDGGGNLIGTIIEVSSDDNNDENVKKAAKELLLQITAYNPQYVTADEIPADVINAEREIQLEITKKENAESAKPKPESVLEKIVEGRLKKFREEIVLYDQNSFASDGNSVKTYLNSIGKKMEVKRFIRFEKGEGIAKKEDDFAAEVASLTGN